MCPYQNNTDRKQAPNLAETTQTFWPKKLEHPFDDGPPSPLPRRRTHPPRLSRRSRGLRDGCNRSAALRRPGSERAAPSGRAGRAPHARAQGPSRQASQPAGAAGLGASGPGASETCGPASRAAGGALEAAAGGPAHEERRVQGFSQGRWSKWRRSAFQ